jgi:hypothetical protein
MLFRAIYEVREVLQMLLLHILAYDDVCIKCTAPFVFMSCGVQSSLLLRLLVLLSSVNVHLYIMLCCSLLQTAVSTLSSSASHGL